MIQSHVHVISRRGFGLLSIYGLSLTSAEASGGIGITPRGGDGRLPSEMSSTLRGRPVAQPWPGQTKREINGTDAIRKTVLAGTNIFGEPASVLVRRSVLVDAGGWEGRFPDLIDQATHFAMLIRGNLVAVPRSLNAVRVSPSQWCTRLGGI